MRNDSYREIISDLIDDLHKSSTYKTWLSSYADCSNLSKGSFFHGFVGNLVVSSFGIGECSECSTLLSIELADAGFGDLAFVSLHFSNAKPGMEMTHQFIVTNLPKVPEFRGDKMTCDMLFSKLPEDAFIGDVFLGTCFSPRHVPEVFKRYMKVYGGTAELSIRHQYNLSKKSFSSYLMVAADVIKKLPFQKHLPDLGMFSSVESWKKHKSYFFEQKADKRINRAQEHESVVTLPIPSTKSEEYINRLDCILGDARGKNIIQKNAAGTLVSLPLFWLKQLDDKAIHELADGLEAKPEELLKTPSMG